MPLSSQLSEMIRIKIDEASRGHYDDVEMAFIKPLTDLQSLLSHLPGRDEFLIEYLESTEGYHLLMYPFEGRFVHEGLASLVAHRISRIVPISFSIAMNDYGFELLTDQPIPVEEAIETNVLGEENLLTDIQASINSTEMARRKFRDIAAISGLVFKGFGDGTPSANDIGIKITTGSNAVYGCYVGTDAAGTTAGGITFYGININSSGNN